MVKGAGQKKKKKADRIELHRRNAQVSGHVFLWTWSRPMLIYIKRGRNEKRLGEEDPMGRDNHISNWEHSAITSFCFVILFGLVPSFFFRFGGRIQENERDLLNSEKTRKKRRKKYTHLCTQKNEMLSGQVRGHSRLDVNGFRWRPSMAPQIFHTATI